MSKYTKPDPLADAFKPSMQDVAQMSRDLAEYSPRIINGRRQYPFELYLESKEVIRFGDFGEIHIRKPMEYKRLSDIHSLWEWKRDKDLLEVLATMPEEKAAHEAKIAEIGVEVRALFKKMRVKQTP